MTVPVHALSDVNLQIAPGDFVSFIGPSGCGKTTFLRVIADLEQPTGGSITVNGMTPEAARTQRTYGYVFQAAGLYPWRTIEKNIRLPLEIMGYSKAEMTERTASVLDLVGLSDFAKKYPWQLSGGMQQRASIARALAFDADLLLMDEPFGALDEIVRDHLNEQLLALWKRTEKTVCFVTHSIPEAVYPVDQDRGDVAQTRPHHRRHRQSAASGAAPGNPGQSCLPRGRGPCPQRASAPATVMMSDGVATHGLPVRRGLAPRFAVLDLSVGTMA